MKILVVGDSHGDLGFLQWAIDRAEEHEVDQIVQVGDFGYWEHTLNGVQFLDKLDRRLRKKGFTLHWVDGNHENHELLREKYDLSQGLTPIRDNIIHIPRGARWEWDGVTFLGIGGAHSIDRDTRLSEYARRAPQFPADQRHRLISWWPEETITDDELQKCLTGPVDVVFSHDAPMSADIPGEFQKMTRKPFLLAGETDENRAKLETILVECEPQFWYHGHYHLTYTQRVNGCRIRGLNCNINQFHRRDWHWNDAIAIFDTEDVQ